MLENYARNLGLKQQLKKLIGSTRIGSLTNNNDKKYPFHLVLQLPELKDKAVTDPRVEWVNENNS